ncbi:CapA family protein [Pigmentiphaga sp. H8]|uniref:CapA family protein n=1 Tax=Pigmentiphaga sp. H8 TaxID=2488560 RepID=UPI000F5B693D|nr:CapA family protein [Pigmentiphaga sp. H8]AZG06756.1 CapA family protein [Pigmentiphaga sp. H8]
MENNTHAKMGEIVFVAAGDVFVNRDVFPDSAFRDLQEFIRSADARFCNLETTFASAEASPAAISGGTWARTSENHANILTDYGFNIVAAATNHALDFGERGLLDTIGALRKAGLAHAGAGADLAQASQACFVETAAGRVGLISMASTFHESAAAGAQRMDMRGRPGVNPLRHRTVYTLPAAEIECLRSIAQATGINDHDSLRIKEGFSLAADGVDHVFGGIGFRAGPEPGPVSRPDARDMARTLAGIRDARAQADYVLVSIHSHEMHRGNKCAPAGFLKEAAHAYIDAGAHAILCHGPHVMRGLEIYKGCPIFYSLGNFIFQNETVASLPSDFYEKYGLDERASPQEAFDARSDQGRKGLATNPDIWRAVLPRWTMKEGRLEALTLHPVTLGPGQPRWRRGTPALVPDEDILRDFQKLCEPYGTRLHIEDGMGRLVM